MALAGGCLCGAVRFACEGPVLRQLVCHCRDCQRAGGSAFHVGVIVPRSSFTLLQGTLTKYRAAADSGRWIERGFCPVCGSGITVDLELAPNVVGLKAGTLDDPSLVTPTYELFARSKAPWLTVGDEIESFGDMIPEGWRPKGR